MQVPSLAGHSGLRIQNCNTCSSGQNCGSALIPGTGAPYAAGRPKKLKKKKEKKSSVFQDSYQILEIKFGDITFTVFMSTKY